MPRILALLLLAGCPSAPVEPDPEPETPAPADHSAAEPTELLPEAWLVTSLGSDPFGDDLAEGRFDMPVEGETDGVTWTAVVPDESGVVGEYPSSVVYAAALVDVPEEGGLFAAADRAWSVWLEDRPQPANVYGGLNLPVPLTGRAGERMVVLRGFGGRGANRIKLWTTPDPVYMNLGDLTWPHLVQGDETERWLGVPTLNFAESPVLDLVAAVVEDEHWQATEQVFPALPPGATTQVPFLLLPQGAWTYEAPAEGEDAPSVEVRLRLSAPAWDRPYEVTITLELVPEAATHQRTFKSPLDDSVQYYGVVPPSNFDLAADYAAVLSLHGAGVGALGQARSYSQRDGNYVFATTNRRPFGFDHEEWGRFNDLATLDDARSVFHIDDTRTYLTGHSMGGHGTWHVGVTTPGRFALVGPSAGWESFYSYGGSSRPGGALARSRAHSDTLVYLENLARRTAYIIHGDADDNVPISEGDRMRAALLEYTDDVFMHVEEGAGHWWDGDVSAGVDCVDWQPMFDLMSELIVDPLETDFFFRSAGAHYNPDHSYVRLQSALTPWEDIDLLSEATDEGLVLTTTNARSLEIDGAGLRGRGFEAITVDGVEHDLPDGPLWVGPADGKTADQHGTFNQVFRRPFCFVYDEAGSEYAEFAGYMISAWSLIGNGSACAVPVSELTDALRAERNLVWLGVAMADVGESATMPLSWDDESFTLGEDRFTTAALLFVFPRGEHLDAAIVTAPGDEELLMDVVPWSSRSGLPDYYVWSRFGGVRSGFFENDWTYVAP